MVTINDVAAHAGVGASTVSRVLNDSPRVSADTRARVLAAIDALDYRPNPLARGLSRGRCQTLGVVVPFFTHAVGRRAAAGCGRRARRQPVRPRPVQRRVAGAPRRALRRADPPRTGPTGSSCCRCPPPPADLDRLATPACRSCSSTPGRGVPMVVTDDVEGGRIATRHLLALGHERIAFIGDDARQPASASPRARAASAATARSLARRRPRRSGRATCATAPHDRERRPAAHRAAARPTRAPDRGVRVVRRAGDRRARGGAVPPGSRVPETCRSSGSTTSRSPPTPVSPPCASRCSRAGASAPNCCSPRSTRAADRNAGTPSTVNSSSSSVDDGCRSSPSAIDNRSRPGGRQAYRRHDGARRGAMAEIVLDDVWKVYRRRHRGGAVARPRHRRRGVHGARRPVGLRQDHGAADGRRAGGDLEGRRSRSATGSSTTCRPRSATSRWCSRTTRSTRT